MCEYCKNDGYYNRNKSLISKTLKNNVDIDLSINVKDKKIVASIENLAMSIEDDNWFLPTKKINYCPMCRTKTSPKLAEDGRKGGKAMTKDQEEAIEIIERMIKSYIEADECGLSNNDFKHEIKAMQTVLSMLKQKDKEIEHLKENIDYQILCDFLISSTSDEAEPTWTEKHIEELLENFEVRWKDAYKQDS